MWPSRRSVECPRCEHRYPADRDSCPHCTGLTDHQARRFRMRARQSAEQHRHNLIRLAVFVAGLALIALMKYM